MPNALNPASRDLKLNAKSKYIKSRVNVATDMSSREISKSSEFQENIRMHCFFSARVAESRILDRIRYYSDQYSSGKIDKNSARAYLKSFLRGQGYDPDGAINDNQSTDHSIKNLASTGRLNLILSQNKLMATSIGKKEEISRLGAPFMRYVPSWKRDKRESHKKFYNTILPTDHAFWDTHTGPLDFECGCSVQAVWDEDEAKKFGGVSSAQPIDQNSSSSRSSRITDHESLSSDTWALKNSNGGFKVEPPESGFVFNSATPFSEFDTSRIKNPILRSAVVEEAEVIFGDQISIQKNIVKLLPKKYKTWESLGLASAKTWEPIAVPVDIAPLKARKMLEKGIKITSVDKNVVTLGDEILKHWHVDGKKLTLDIEGRLKRLNWAVTTLEDPQEIWQQKNQKGYFQIFKKSTGGIRGCLVFVSKSGIAKTYFISALGRINKARKGLKIIEIKK